SFSRHQFVWPTFVQTTEAVCEGLDRAWRFFDAMIKTLVPDNMKSIIKEADALNPVLVAAFLDYAQARGIFVNPARVRSPKDKPRVENQVPFVRESWFDGETFVDLDDARQRAEHWCREVAGMRVHGTTRKVPRELFESVEKPAMLAPPTEPFDVPRWVDDAKVHPDHHVQVASALYSVPTLYLHKQVRVRADKTSVRIYFGTALIKVHPRLPPGGRSTDANDYPVGKAAYAMRSVETVMAKAKAKGVHIGTFTERLLGGPLPWTRMRQAYALLRLCEKYGDGRVEAVCQSALAFDVVDVSRITRMLKVAAKPAPAPGKPPGKLVQLTLPRFARADQHFETRSNSKNEEGKS
ncbi:MAG: IS21 family transposase, partial [Polyangiaceae bacterium]